MQLRFNGTRMNVPIAGAGTPSGPLATLADRASACQEKSVERLFALHTAKSAAKLKQWFGTMNASALDSYFAEQARPRDVRLLVDAGPLVIAFSAPKTPDGSPGRDVRFDYMVRQADTYKIANVLYVSFFDDLLKGTTAVAAFLEKESASPPK